MKSEKRLNTLQKDGATLRQHYEMAEKHGHKIPELKQPEIPQQVKYIWRWYCELTQSREYINTFPMALKWSEIQAWSNMLKRSPNEWEMNTLIAMDRSYING